MIGVMFSTDQKKLKRLEYNEALTLAVGVFEWVGKIIKFDEYLN